MNRLQISLARATRLGPMAGGYAASARSGRESRALAVRAGTDRIRIGLLAGLGLVLIGIHLSLLHQIGSRAQFGLSLMVWPALIHMVRRRWATVPLESGLVGAVCGGGVLVVVLMNSLWMDRSNQVYPYLFPLLGGIGLGLLAVGFRGLQRYWRELTLLALLGIPRLLLTAWDGLALITAKVATFVIWYLGYEVQLQGVEIFMPGGAVVVDPGCAGPGVISYLLSLAAVFGFLFPVSTVRWIVALVIAPLIAVCTNLFRIVLLALLENAGRHDLFEFWHHGTGVIVWTMLPILVFFGLAMVLVDRRRLPATRGQPGAQPAADAAGDERTPDDPSDDLSFQDDPVPTRGRP